MIDRYTHSNDPLLGDDNWKLLVQNTQQTRRGHTAQGPSVEVGRYTVAEDRQTGENDGVETAGTLGAAEVQSSWLAHCPLLPS